MSDFYGFEDEVQMRELFGNGFTDSVLSSKVSERKLRVCKAGDWPCLGGGWHEGHPFDYGDFHDVPHETLKNEDGTPLLVHRQNVRYQDMGQMLTIHSVVYKGKTISWGGRVVDL